jgi:hypothetical protein
MLLLNLSSCIKNQEFTPNAKLQISTDTLFFDTLFTRQPTTGTYPISVTKLLYVKNPSSLWVKADFEVAGGPNSPYRMNVDGISGNSIKGIEIAPNDSVFLFVQCKLEANNETQPMLVLDSIYSRVGTQSSKLILAAYGWDAHYVKDSILADQTIWSDKTKPYVIIDGAYVAPNNTFTIEEGVHVYSSARSGLFVFGNLRIKGSATQRVKFQGDKPMSRFQNLPNQWYGMFVLPGGTADIAYADITNAIIGLRADSQSLGINPCVTLQNTRIQYCGQACLIGVTGAIKAENCLFADAGSYTFLGYFGGRYEFNHCTFAEHSYFTNRNAGHFGLTNTLRDGNGFLIDTRDAYLSLNHSIIWGYKTEELAFDASDRSRFDLLDGNYNLLKTENKDSYFQANTHLFNQNPKFMDIRNGDYHLDTNSSAINKIPILNTTLDLEGTQRTPPADIGAYEYK